MTTLGEESEKCCLCDTTSKFFVLVSTSSFGPPDLDTRSSSPARHSIEFWIRRCPSCGYCAPRISRTTERIRATVASTQYKAQLSDDTYPELANRFLCWSVLQENVGAFADAGWASLNAAWACDDNDLLGAGRQCRLRTIELFRAARKQGRSFAQDIGAEEAILADVLRRAQRLDEVRSMCEEGLAKEPGDVIRKVLRYQMRLAAAQDTNCHTIEEAMKAV